MSDAALHLIHLVANTVYGTTQVNPEFKELRKTGCTLNLSKSTLTSAELKGNRMPGEIIHGVKSVGGEISGELSYSTYDALLEAGFGGTWSTPSASVSEANDISINGTGFLDSDGSEFVNALPIGTIIKVSGFTNAANNGIFKLSAISTTSAMQLIHLDGSAITSVVEAAAIGKTITVRELSRLAPGLVRRDFTILREFSDQGDKPFHLYENVEVNTIALSQDSEGLTSISFGVMGKEASVGAAAPSGSTFLAPTTTLPMTGFQGNVKEGATELPCTEMTFNLDNGLAAEYVIGSRNPRRHTIAISNVSGQAVVPFENTDLIEKFYNEETGLMSLLMTDLTGNGYLVVLPRVTFTGGQPDVSGPGTIPLTVPYSALEVDADNYHCYICKVPA